MNNRSDQTAECDPILTRSIERCRQICGDMNTCVMDEGDTEEPCNERNCSSYRAVLTEEAING